MQKRKYSEELLMAANQNINARNYWLNKLSRDIVKNGFPYDSIKKTKKKHSKETVRFTFPPELFTRLTSISRGSDYTMHVILTAGLNALLSKYTDSKDFIVGTPIYKQDVETEFINTVLALRNQLEEDTTFKELLLQVRQTIIEAAENQNYPIEILLEQLGMSVSDNEFPLFDTALLFEGIHDKAYIDHIRPNMIFSFHRCDHHIEGAVEYNSLLYEKATIERITSHFTYLQKQALFDPDLPISQIEILSEEEKKQLLYEFNHTETQYPEDKMLYQLFEKQVEKTPGKIALIFEKQSLTYRELNERSNQLTRLLRSRGIKPETVVGLMADISNETITGMIGILKAGGAFLPIDSDYPGHRIRYIIEDIKPGILLTAGPPADKIPISGEIIDLRDPSIFTGDFSNLESLNQPGHLVYVMYTSGSTGNPKGVMIEHRNIVNQIHGLKEMFFSGRQLNHILLAPFTFDPSVQHVFSPLTYGGKLFLVSRAIKVDAERLLEFIVENRIDVLDAVPSQASLLVEFAGKYDCQPLQYIILAGEVFTYELYLRLETTFSAGKIINIYGPTEATINTTCYECKKDSGGSRVPIGRPLMNYKIRVLDNRLNLLPIGVSGQIFIAGAGIARGYFNRPEETEEKFIENPLVPGERMYASGDLAKWLQDGNLEFLGRSDDQVKIRGMRVETGEIEKQLLKHKGIKDAVIVAREDGESDKYLCVYYVSGEQFEVAHLKRTLSESLPSYMVPAYFVRLAKIPLTANDKLNYKALPLPEAASLNEHTAPADKVEKMLSGIWSQLLNTAKEKISMTADFFEIGGHSLKATILASKIHQAFNIKIPLRNIFETPTIRKLAEFIKGTEEDKYVTIKLAENKEYHTLSSAQKRLYILQQLEKESTGYNMPHIMKLEEDIDRDKLKEAFLKLIKRHESLRTSFEIVKGNPVQRVHEKLAFDIEYYEAGPGMPGAKPKEIVKRFVRTFDLSQAPLLRVGLGKIGEKKHLLLVDMHHIAADGISNEILVGDFLTLHRGEELPPLRLRYKDYS